jgi:hypothetical protein
VHAPRPVSRRRLRKTPKVSHVHTLSLQLPLEAHPATGLRHAPGAQTCPPELAGPALAPGGCLAVPSLAALTGPSAVRLSCALTPTAVCPSARCAGSEARLASPGPCAQPSAPHRHTAIQVHAASARTPQDAQPAVRAPKSAHAAARTLTFGLRHGCEKPEALVSTGDQPTQPPAAVWAAVSRPPGNSASAAKVAKDGSLGSAGAAAASHGPASAASRSWAAEGGSEGCAATGCASGAGGGCEDRAPGSAEALRRGSDAAAASRPAGRRETSRLRHSRRGKALHPRHYRRPSTVGASADGSGGTARARLSLRGCTAHPRCALGCAPGRLGPRRRPAKAAAPGRARSRRPAPRRCPPPRSSWGCAPPTHGSPRCPPPSQDPGRCCLLPSQASICSNRAPLEGAPPHIADALRSPQGTPGGRHVFIGAQRDSLAASARVTKGPASRIVELPGAAEGTWVQT